MRYHILKRKVYTEPFTISVRYDFVRSNNSANFNESSRRVNQKEKSALIRRRYRTARPSDTIHHALDEILETLADRLETKKHWRSMYSCCWATDDTTSMQVMMSVAFDECTPHWRGNKTEKNGSSTNRMGTAVPFWSETRVKEHRAKSVSLHPTSRHGNKPSARQISSAATSFSATAGAVQTLPCPMRSHHMHFCLAQEKKSTRH